MEDKRELWEGEGEKKQEKVMWYICHEKEVLYLGQKFYIILTWGESDTCVSKVKSMIISMTNKIPLIMIRESYCHQYVKVFYESIRKL